MKSPVNYYLILSVSPSAGEGEIKRAFLKMAQKYHPDKNRGNKLAERKFQQVNLAYQTLRDPEKRRAFDESLKKARLKPPDAKPAAGPAWRGSAAPGKEKALDLEVPLELSLESLCRPQTRRVSYIKPANGKKIKSHLDVPIPLGIRPGARLKFKKLGGAAGSRLFGDLYVKIALKDHKIFQRRKTGILLSAPVRFVDIIKGGKIKIPSLYGPVSLALPLHVLTESRPFRLKGLGLPGADGARGDMFVTVLVDYPKGDRAKIQRLAKNLSPEKKRYLIRKYDSEACLYPKVLDFQKKLRDMREGGAK